MHNMLVRAKAILGGEEGHALMFLVLSLGLMMVFAVGIYIVSEAAVTKIRTQNAADAAALAGAGLLADCMDLLVFANWVRPFSLLLSPWSPAVTAVINRLQEEVIRHGPTAVNARAVQVGLANGALVIPVHRPDLGVERTWLGFVADTLGGRTGNRFVQLLAQQKLQLPQWVETFLGEYTPSEAALYPTASARGIVHGRGMSYAHYVGGLGRME
ncbi:MAG: hypothetical protein GX855_10855 [Firmicutes bacterium]|nr:hypothetical protein [Bacillota bacterium]